MIDVMSFMLGATVSLVTGVILTGLVVINRLFGNAQVRKH